MTTKHTPTWDLEEIPYETNDPFGGWYLHFDSSGDLTDAVLYMSKANVTEDQAALIAAAPVLLAAAEAASRQLNDVLYAEWGTSVGETRLRNQVETLRAAIAKARGEGEA